MQSINHMTSEIIAAMVGCTGLWEFLKYLFSNHCKKKFDIDEAVQEIQKDIAVLHDNQESMQRSLASISASAAEDRAITARVRILSFADDMMSNRKHSKDAFDQTLCDIDNYDRYCNEHPEFKNNQTAMSREMILDQYKECEREGSFLQYRRRRKHEDE